MPGVKKTEINIAVGNADKKKHLTGSPSRCILRQVIYLDRGRTVEKSRLRQTMLLDLYGDLLTDKQRECYDLHYNEDLSLSEIAEQLSISRQGVWDNIRRAEISLAEYEEKTGLLERFDSVREKITDIRRECEKLGPVADGITSMLAALETEL